MNHPPIGLSFRAEVDPHRIQRIAGAAARFDFAALSVWDDLGDPPPLPLLLALAGANDTARLGFACLAVPKYPSLDGVAGALAALSAGRSGTVFLGLAPGAWMDQVGLRPAGVQRVREAALAARYLLERRTEGYAGRYYHIAPGFRLSFETPSARIPLLIGGWGERLLALGGELADEVKIGGSAAPELPAIARQRIATGAAKNRRDPEDIGIVMGAVTIVDGDRAAAMRAARQRAATYIPVVGPRDPVASRDFPDAIAAVSEAMARGNLEQAERSIPDTLLRRFAFAGTPADVIAQVEALLAAGASRVDFGSPHGLDPAGGIELIGTRVLPYFRP
jgi:5,10-methylenetetrahydromethanopterin reductase